MSPLKHLPDHERLTRLNHVIHHNATYSPFWQRHWRGITEPFGAGFNSLDEAIVKLPLVQKTDLQQDHEAHPPYGSHLSQPANAYTRFCRTSGSTGSPMAWLDTTKNWNWMIENWQPILSHTGLPKGAPAMFAFSFGPFLGFWAAFDAAQHYGCLCIPGGGMSSNQRLSLMDDHTVSTLFCTPTYALHLGQLAQESESICRNTLSHIIVAGEPGGCIPGVRQRLKQLWPNATVFDHHGMTEVGPVSYQRIDTPHDLFILKNAYLAEVIDPETKLPKPDGEGELVLTTLGREDNPIIRYRTGDRVHLVSGSSKDDYKLVGGILARQDDMQIIRGVNIYPSALDNIIRQQAAIDEYEVHILERNHLKELRIHIDINSQAPNPDDIAEGLAQQCREHFGLRIPVVPVKSGSLPRYEMKAKRWKTPITS